MSLFTSPAFWKMEVGLRVRGKECPRSLQLDIVLWIRISGTLAALIHFYIQHSEDINKNNYCISLNDYTIDNSCPVIHPNLYWPPVCNRLEAMSLWMDSCEVLPHFRRRSWLSGLLLSGRGSRSPAAVVVRGISQVHSGVEVRRWCRLRTASANQQGECGWWMEVLPWWMLVKCDDLLHDFTSASHDSMDIRM